MSIATIGPAKYDFQDFVCIKFALDFYKFENATLIVEGEGVRMRKFLQTLTARRLCMRFR